MKPTPDYALKPARDPLLREPLGRRVCEALGRWAAAIAFVLAFLAAAGTLDRMDAEADRRALREELARKERELADMRHGLALREASGNCSTLFYLVEADDMQQAGEKLVQASMRISDAVNSALYPSPLPPLKTQ